MPKGLLFGHSLRRLRSLSLLSSLLKPSFLPSLPCLQDEVAVRRQAAITHEIKRALTEVLLQVGGWHPLGAAGGWVLVQGEWRVAKQWTGGNERAREWCSE